MSRDLVEASGRVLDAVVSSMGGSVREGQASMVAEGAAALEDREHLLVQAGTGTGKSLGYLVPLLTHCAVSGVRGLVSTATLALQRQILVKDAPVVVDAVASATGVRLKVAVLKGWSNYACMHKLDGGYPTEGTLFEDRDIGAGPTGELGKEILRIREWISETTTGDRDDLVPGVSDRAWHHASVAKPECLGKHCPLIDEAHELADRVRSQAAADLSVARVSRVARSLRSNLSIDSTDLDEAGAGLGAAMAPVQEGLLEYRPSALVDAMTVLDDAARRASTEVGKAQGDGAAKQLARAAIDELIGALDAWGRDPDQSIAYITRDDADNARLTVGPLDVSGAIGGVGIGERGAILTSATLALGGSFDYMAQATGMALTGVPWHGIDVGSPFDHARQGIRYVARHLPPPGRDGPSEQLLDELVELAQASGGGALALFASLRGAQAGAQALRERTELTVYLQGEETLAQLIGRFREERDSCLVGTMSLWQGVDVVGDACRLVVIDKIPFPRPDDPVSRARSKAVERRGGNGFMSVCLTHAALMMAQGAGRLLRSTEDRGVVAILDPRALTKRYGAFILASLPPLWPTTDPHVVRGALRRLNSAGDQ